MQPRLKSALLAALLVLAPASAFAWGAIAVSDAEGKNAEEVGYGFVIDEDNEDDAKREALKACRANNRSCKVAVTFETCGGYAVSGSRWGSADAATKGAARRIALANCGNAACRVVTTQCNN
ncbi:Domain of unknown function DUF4189 [Rhabdaerophilaceae bacterium]